MAIPSVCRGFWQVAEFARIRERGESPHSGECGYVECQDSWPHTSEPRVQWETRCGRRRPSASRTRSVRGRLLRVLQDGNLARWETSAGAVSTAATAASSGLEKHDLERCPCGLLGPVRVMKEER